MSPRTRSARTRLLLPATALTLLLALTATTPTTSTGANPGTRPGPTAGPAAAPSQVPSMIAAENDKPTTRAGKAVRKPGTHQRRSVLILAKNDEGKFRPSCTGSMVADRLVLTAGHCTDNGTMKLVPAAHRPKGSKTFKRPYGTCTVRAVSFDMQGEDGWTSRNDYALLSTGSCTKGPKNRKRTRYVGRLTGAWPVLETSNGWWDEGDNAMFTAGYPGDKPKGTMWSTKHVTIDNFQDHSGIATNELAGGASGSPMVAKDSNGVSSIVAIARAVYSPGEAGTGKTGGVQCLRMTEEVQEKLREWASIMQ